MKILHVVSFDVPYPPDYGGASAVLQLLILLQANGVHVILHVYTYRDRKVTDTLKELCFRVFEYKRDLGFSKQFSTLPYIVNTRNAPKLLENLHLDHYPILFEGIHTTKYLPELLKAKRKIFLRAHNYEAAYYSELAKFETSILKKIYFKLESYRLKKYEMRIVSMVRKVFCFTEKDAKTFTSFGADSIIFNPNIIDIKPNIKEGKGIYLLIHANLSINDNVHSSLQVLKNIADKVEVKIVLTGKNPTPFLISECLKYANVELIANPLDSELISLIQNAHINLCYSEISEGFKIRIRTLLQYGRFILSNDAFCEDTSIQEMMIMENKLTKWSDRIMELMQKSFDNSDLKTRQRKLDNLQKGNNINDVINILFATD